APSACMRRSRAEPFWSRSCSSRCRSSSAVCNRCSSSSTARWRMRPHRLAPRRSRSSGASCCRTSCRRSSPASRSRLHAPSASSHLSSPSRATSRSRPRSRLSTSSGASRAATRAARPPSPWCSSASPSSSCSSSARSAAAPRGTMGKYLLRFGSLGYLAVLLLAPVGVVFYRAFEDGFWPAWHAVTSPDAVHALKLPLVATAIAVPANMVFGVLCALAIVRYRVPGFALVNALVDLPLALSPVAVGFSLLLLYGRNGWLGGHNVLFATPGIVLATIFVSLPFVVREVVPVLREIGTEPEQAASTLGASGFEIF